MKKRKSLTPVGSIPGTLVYTGDKSGDVEINILQYDENDCNSIKLTSEEVDKLFSENPISLNTWIDVSGIHDIKLIEKIGKNYGFHPLLLEDIVNVDQRPKIDFYQNYLFIILKILHYNEESRELDVEHMAFILGKNTLFTIHENAHELFERVRERIKDNKGNIRQSDVKYLFYTIVDMIVDEYFVILEKLGEEIDEIEDAVISNPVPQHAHWIHQCRENLLKFRRLMWPVREILNEIIKENVNDSSSLYFRDVYDHIIQILETIESFREMTSSLLDLYLSSLSTKTNDIMKTLTIIATIFMPLTFIAGIYGMNFKYMPEIYWKFGYPFVLFLMLFLAIFMLVFFKRKRWI